jgi:DNA-binding SARP family transcriptional activator
MIFSDAAIRAVGDRPDRPGSISFSLLGPVQARRGPAEVDTGPRQQRAILALLLVRANERVSVQDMIGVSP